MQSKLLGLLVIFAKRSARPTPRSWSTRRAAGCSVSGPPHWPAYPPGAAYARIYDRDPAADLAAARLGARLIAADLLPLGINVDCLPLADVPVTEADAVIGDRAYGDTPAKVAAIAAAVAQGLLDGGVLPVLKHIPGHGRATADSHERLPVVDADRATLEATRFRRIPAAKHAAARHDRTCCVHRD